MERVIVSILFLVLLGLVLIVMKSRLSKASKKNSTALCGSQPHQVNPCSEVESQRKLNKLKQDFESQIQAQKEYYEELLNGCKERDKEYGFLKSRCHNEIQLRRNIERQNIGLKAEIVYLKTEIIRIRRKHRHSMTFLSRKRLGKRVVRYGLHDL